jgi:FixJ family two-component response regulator
MNNVYPLVSVVDDDESVRESLPDLLRIFGFSVDSFGSAKEFLASNALEETQCLVLDVAMPGMTGPELQRELFRRGRPIPTVFITASRDDAARKRLIERGAADCLFKPFSGEAINQAIRSALGLL